MLQRSLTKSFTLSAAVLTLGALAHADGDAAGAPAFLSSDVAAIGGTVRLELRGQLPGAQALIALGFNPIPIVLGSGLPVLHVGPPIALPGGVLGPDGRLVVHVPVPAAYPPGTEVFAQGAIIAATPTVHVVASNTIRLAPGGTAAGYTNETLMLPASTATNGAADVDWADVDGDGFEDLLVANEGDGAVSALLRNLTGTGFADETAGRLPVAAQISVRHIEAGDVDADGDLDLFLGAGIDSSAPAANLLLLNDGAGFFTVDAAFPAGAGTPIDAEFGDVDGDGDLDLFVASVQDMDHLVEVPDGVVLYANSGGAFTAESSFALLGASDPHTSGGGISLGDADNDGDLDLFVARADTTNGGAQNQFLVNDGTGVFDDITAISVESILDNSFEAEFVDANGDGWLDVVVANSVSSVPGHNYLLNLGISAGTGQVAFNDVSAWMPADFGGATKVRTGLDVADVDGDGDPDVLISIHQLFDSLGMLDGDAVLLLNQGGFQGGTVGTFAVDPTFDVGGSGFVCGDAAFGDFDHDGDPDLYLGSDGDLFGAMPPQDALLRNDL